MAQAFSSLLRRLAEAVPARDEVPNQDQLETELRDSVADYNRRAGWVKETSIQVEAGIGSYALPADCVSVDSFAANRDSAAAVTATGIVPLSTATAGERWVVEGNNLLLFPIPEYTEARTIVYRAGHVLNDDGVYPAMTDLAAALILHRAQASILMLQANVESANALSYGVGEERYSKEQVAKNLREQAREKLAWYERGITSEASSHATSAVKPMGMRSRYRPTSRW